MWVLNLALTFHPWKVKFCILQTHSHTRTFAHSHTHTQTKQLVLEPPLHPIGEKWCDAHEVTRKQHRIAAEMCVRAVCVWMREKLRAGGWCPRDFAWQIMWTTDRVVWYQVYLLGGWTHTHTLVTITPFLLGTLVCSQTFCHKEQKSSACQYFSD